MTEQGKQLYREEHARKAMDNWTTCPLSDLQAAAAVFDGALLLLIQRMVISDTRYASLRGQTLCRISQVNRRVHPDTVLEFLAPS